ncbi:thioredoxin domain-containing protein [Olivibacter sp. CPCC 100613]|uniref:thioredoxin domain-containing protein n=1 Tax=Olivibacter sp. CPCC 100613 TaxID=3079931 RepID=UPI002FF93580
MANHLQNETSPYLKQHQRNPVDWYPWGDDALQKAQTENKLLIVSIGYSACHWCHVMEKESFENEDVAHVMNSHFVSIKVDREERPDIDQLYMTAVQLMTNAGGWPLNCICLPDGRPIYGGTYFRSTDWVNILNQVQTLWTNEAETAINYAEKLAQGITASETFSINKIPDKYSREDLKEIVEPWRETFDFANGGYKRAPKFPLPSNWVFFLRYGHLTNDTKILSHTHFTLKHIASGGIYDQLGGGFARYAVDGQWHVPHFEKMLYDNAQLVSLYAEAYLQNRDPFYKRIIEETLEWVNREMTSAEGGFFSALDADSEGVEGKYYTFQQEEIEKVLGEDAPLLIEYFSITAEGNWLEEKTNVLRTSFDADRLAEQAGYSFEEWQAYLKDIKRKLLHYRAQRIRPGTDDKILTSWNAMMLKAYLDAYRTLNKPEYLTVAQRSASFILDKLITKDGVLLHQPATPYKTITAFLDDYAFVIDAFITLYEVSFDKSWLDRAKSLMDYTLRHFYDQQSTAFYYSSDLNDVLITRKFEIMDNVIPSSNSVMAHQLNKLGVIFEDPTYKEISAQLLANVFPQIRTYGSAYSNWAIRLLEEVCGFNEIAITGPEAKNLRIALDQHLYIPNKVILGGEEENLPLLVNRVAKHNLIYVCKNNTCSLPVDNLKDVENLILKPEA